MIVEFPDIPREEKRFAKMVAGDAFNCDIKRNFDATFVLCPLRSGQTGLKRLVGAQARARAGGGHRLASLTGQSVSQSVSRSEWKIHLLALAPLASSLRSFLWGSVHGSMRRDVEATPKWFVPFSGRLVLLGVKDRPLPPPSFGPLATPTEQAHTASIFRSCDERNL